MKRIIDYMCNICVDWCENVRSERKSARKISTPHNETPERALTSPSRSL